MKENLCSDNKTKKFITNTTPDQ